MEGRKNPKNLPEENLNCLERSSHAMRLSHRDFPYGTSGDIAKHAMLSFDDVHHLAVDSTILGWMIDTLFLQGKTPDQVAQWMVDNGVRKQHAALWRDRAPMPWDGEASQRRADEANG